MNSIEAVLRESQSVHEGDGFWDFTMIGRSKYTMPGLRYLIGVFIQPNPYIVIRLAPAPSMSLFLVYRVGNHAYGEVA